MNRRINPLRILYITPYVPSLIRVRPYNLIKHLSRRGHLVTVLSLQSTEQEVRDAEELRSCCHRVETVRLTRQQSLLNCLKALPTTTPLQAAYCHSPAMQRLIGRVLKEEQFDIVHVEHLRAVNYGLRTLGFGLPVIWDSVDCIHLLFKRTLANSTLGARFKAWLDLERTYRYEKWLMSQFDRVLITSEEDAQAMQEMVAPNCHQPADISVLPNGVDLDYFQPQATPRVPATLIYLGRMRYHANVAAVLYLVNDIMPHIWAHRPDVTLLIVGSDPPRVIRRLAANHQTRSINVTGTVPDVRPYLAQATVMVAPIRYGAGTSFKVLEAMAMGTPVVATLQAVRGLQVYPGEDVLMAEDAETFAACVLRLLQDEALQQKLAQNGRQYVERYHAWDKIAASLENVYLEVIEQRDNSRRLNECIIQERAGTRSQRISQ